jgi:hypothetical protein
MLDGNAAGGLLREIFAFEATSAEITCGGCGAVFAVGAAPLYGGSMGAVLRCAGCGDAVLRITRTPRGLWLDLQGARSVVARPT